MKARHLMLIMWPSFLMAGVASGVVFALIDPLDVAIFGYITFQREVLYALAFFFFWFIASMSSLLSLYLMPGSNERDDVDLGF